MDANVLIEKIKQTGFELEQSAANHNALLGKMRAYQELVESMASAQTTPESDSLCQDVIIDGQCEEVSSCEPLEPQTQPEHE